ncbi:MAG: alkaline phosphatase family protein [Candidatus Aenigmarchaeota archaeon]|nr:alkaline phosphatase family protein [Candidatus Aenigmarchaeota archaeon]
MKLLIIGLDGASWSFIDPLIAAGKLPALKALRDRGVRAVLRSTIPPASCPAWDSFITGKNPGKLGVYDVFMRRPGTYETMRPDASDRRGTSFWNLLPGKSVIMNLPMTFPPEPVNGILIAGRGATEDAAFTFPPDIKDEINTVAGGYIITPEHHLTIRNLYETLDKQAAVVRHLMEKPWDLFVVNFLATDVVCHGYWGSGEVEKAYEAVDRLVGEMVAKAGSDCTVIVMSDHGIGPPTSVFWPNAWLQQEGFLTPRADRKVPGAGSRIKAAVENVGLGPLAHRLTPGRVRRRFVEPPALEAIDWEKTVAYSIYGNMPRIFLNLQGREPQGTVAPADYEAVREKIAARLRGLQHPDLKDVTVYKREEIYQGPHLEHAPDLLVQFDGFASAYMQPGLDHAPASPMKANFGWHRPEGIFLLAGPGVRTGTVPELSIVDIAPLALYLFSAAIPRDLDGKVRKDLFEPRSPQARRPIILRDPVEKQQERQALTAEQEEKLLRQLKSMGYS